MSFYFFVFLGAKHLKKQKNKTPQCTYPISVIVSLALPNYTYRVWAKVLKIYGNK